MSFLLKGEIMFPTPSQLNNQIIGSGLGPLRTTSFNYYGPMGITQGAQVDQSIIDARTAAVQAARQQQQQQAPAATEPDYRGAALSALNQSAALLNQRENAAIANLDREVASQQRTLQSNVQTGQEKLGRQRETATRQRNQGLRELSQNISNAYKAGMNRLANAGAGDSSATGMYKYALGQQEAQNRGQLISDFNYNIGNIEMATKQLQRDYETKLASLDSWKQSQAFNIRDTFLRNRDLLEQQRASLGGAYVSQATAQLAQTAANNLANLSDQVGSAQGVIQNNFADAAAQLRELSRSNINPNVALQTR
jgi:hypothetical protein